MVGIVSSESTDFRLALREAPRSLSTLSSAHPHGWGLAVWAKDSEWTLRKSPLCANEDEGFGQSALASRGQMLIGHVRKKTVGPVCIENTHPFQREGWVFAHNGTIEDLAFLERGTSPERRGQIEGDTDSELFFSYLLTRLDEEGVANGSSSDVGHVLSLAVQGIAKRANFGACNFLLAREHGLYAHRQGRTLFLLERSPHDEVRPSRASCETGAVIETPWTQRRRAVLIASESMTDEPWRTIEEGSLVFIDRSDEPSITFLTGRE